MNKRLVKHLFLVPLILTVFSITIIAKADVLSVASCIASSASSASSISKQISNIRWGTGNNSKTLYWDAYDGASYYLVSCGERTNVKVKTTSYNFSEYLTEKGTYKASIVGYGSDNTSVTYLNYSPELVVDYNTYKISCYLYDTDYAPITTAKLSINKGYLLKIYTYTDRDASFELDAPSLENYNFVGWSIAGYTSTTNPVTITPETGNQTYIARWRAKTFSVFFDAQGGTYVEPKQCAFGSTIGTLPQTTREHYKFLGWYTAPSGGKLASSLDIMPSQDITYYAHWSPVSYIINLCTTENGSTIYHKQISYTIESENITLPALTKEGYFFDGWTGEGITTPQKDVIIPKGSAGNKTYYANWTVNPCAYEHNYANIITPATTSKDGKIVPTCQNCGIIKEATTIPKVNQIKLASTTYTYDGKEKKPTIMVKDSKGNSLKNNTDYEITYKNNKNVGTATVTISLKGNYTGAITKSFKINPKGTKISSLYGESKKITVKWAKQPTQTSGYQIEYTWPATVATSKIITIKGNTVTTKELTKLTNNRDYYVRIRTYKDLNGTRYYSSWSDQKMVHIDKVQLETNSLSLYRDETKTLKLKYLPQNAKVTWTSSNKKVATVSSSGKITAKKLGTTTITAKYNGITYKAKVTVTYMKPDMAALIYDYDTRNNCFIIKVKNNSPKTVTILSGTTKVLDCDYKVWDRKIYLSKSYAIKPGEIKTIKFKVKGRTTWPNRDDFTLYYYFKVDGKKYYAKADSWTTSKYKSGSSWVNTYRNKDWFIDWREYYIPF